MGCNCGGRKRQAKPTSLTAGARWQVVGQDGKVERYRNRLDALAAAAKSRGAKVTRA